MTRVTQRKTREEERGKSRRVHCSALWRRSVIRSFYRARPSAGGEPYHSIMIASGSCTHQGTF
jgi:Rieske Fe-S protein